MRRNRKQDACLVEELVAQPLVAHLADLQRDESVVLPVQGLDDVSLAARAERPQHLIAVLDEPLGRCPDVSTRLGHGAIIRRGAPSRNGHQVVAVSAVGKPGLTSRKGQSPTGKVRLPPRQCLGP